MTQPAAAAVVTDGYLPDPLQPSTSLWEHHHHNDVDRNDDDGSFFIPIPATHRPCCEDGYTNDSSRAILHSALEPNEPHVLRPVIPGMKPYVLFDKDVLKTIQPSSGIPMHDNEVS